MKLIKHNAICHDIASAAAYVQQVVRFRSPGEKQYHSVLLPDESRAMFCAEDTPEEEIITHVGYATSAALGMCDVPIDVEVYAPRRLPDGYSGPTGPLTLRRTIEGDYR